MLKDATVAIEDERFYKHKGVDYEGVVRAAVKNLVEPQDGPGRLDDHDAAGPQPLHHRASAPTQRKIREAKLAEELENEHTKDWILDKYLNTVPYGTRRRPDRGRRPGRRARSTSTSRLRTLTLREAALLAGLPQAPTQLLARSRSPRRRQAAPQRGAAQDGRARDDHRRAGARKAMRRGLGVKRVRLLHAPPRVATSSTTSRTS